MKDKLIRLVCMILAVIVLLCPLSVCFATEETIVSLVGEEIIGILWDTLKAWGIRIVENGVDEITNNVREWLTGQVYEYLENELHETFDSWITGMQFFRDTFGRLIGNNEYIQAADEFADHLRIAFGLTDDTVVNLDVSYYVGNLALYTFPIYCFAKRLNVSGDSIIRITSSDPGDLYAIPYRMNNYSDGIFAVTKTANHSSVAIACYTTNNQFIYSGSYTPQPVTNSTWYGIEATPSTFRDDDRYLVIDGVQPELSDIREILRNNSNISSQGIVADNDTILLPSDDPTYQSGYSIIYYPDGTIAYLDINWPDTITIDNLPAIVSTGSIPNPGFADVFLPLRAFVNTFTDGMAVIKDVVFHLPTEALAIFYAIMSITVIFGALHMFKEH